MHSYLCKVWVAKQQVCEQVFTPVHNQERVQQVSELSFVHLTPHPAREEVVALRTFE